MTEQRRLTIRAELARRMGWIPEDAVATEQWEIGSLDFTMKPSWRSPSGLRGFKFPPDPFTNAEDNRALVEWLAADDARWLQFDDRLLIALSLQPLPAYDSGNPGFQRMMRQQILTAPLETITLAAARALGIQEVE